MHDRGQHPVAANHRGSGDAPLAHETRYTGDAYSGRTAAALQEGAMATATCGNLSPQRQGGLIGEAAATGGTALHAVTGGSPRVRTAVGGATGAMIRYVWDRLFRL